jgi:subtilisin-like proprotein convertase family protein
MKFIFTRLACLLVASFSIVHATAQQNFFTDVAESAIKKNEQDRVIVPEKYRTLQLDTAGLLAFMRLLPSEESSIASRNSMPVLVLPMPDGTTAKFHVWESSIMEPGLAAAFPGLRTFTGQGIDDRTATIKLDWTEFGFHAMIYSPITGNILIDPYDQKTVTHYISYFKKDHKKKVIFRELPTTANSQKNVTENAPDQVLAGICVGAQLRRYRLAVACTGEYARAATGLTSPTKAQVLAKVVTTVNRVDGVYEKEVAVRLVLVANDTAILFTDPATDPFTGNNDGSTLLGESQTQITNRIGNANYDIGHTFSTGAGGVAIQGVVCETGFKAQGVTGLTNPVGDAYDIDYVAHEMGHQFNASHTFNSISDFCGAQGQWSSTTNAEPGSGSTIMGYATNPSICGTDNLQNSSMDQFHAVSFDEITNFSANGATCAALIATGNNPPVVNAGPDYIIPDSTYFVLTGSATDADGDVLTYCWDQVDVGGPAGAWNAPSGNAPLFRSFRDTTNGNVRYFPKLSDQLNNVRTIGEIMPTYQRTMHFRLTARDNRATGGGVCYDETAITVGTTGKPFKVTYPSASGITWYVNDFQTITWDPNGTAGAPVNCANVTIQLSTDGGNTYDVTLAAGTPNDGSEEIQVPGNLGTACRVRVMAVGNIFYDISNANFRIQVSPTNTFSFNSPVPVNICGNSGSTTLNSAALGTFTTNITLSASLNPAGTTVSFGTTSLAPGSSTTVTLNNTGSLAPGTYTVRITGVAGTITKTKDIQFIVSQQATPPATLTTPAADAVGVAFSPSFNWAAVSGASSYTLEIATASDFSSLAQTITGITTLPYTLTTPLSENTTYYWRVKTVNGCGAGAASTSSRFRTGLSSCKTSSDVPKTISATGTPTVTSTITIPPASGVTITDLNVIGLIGTHAFITDLTFTLTGPNGVSVVIMDQVCPGGYQNFNINFDDQAVSATIPCPPTSGGVRRPLNPLSVFNGINSAGTWTLTIHDNANNEGGALTGWGLNINGPSATSCGITATPLPVVYTFTGTGNWDDAANWSNNTVPPNPLPSGGVILINHATGGNCTLNVSQTISAGATLTVMTGKNLIVPGTLTIQ